MCILISSAAGVEFVLRNLVQVAAWQLAAKPAKSGWCNYAFQAHSGNELIHNLSGKDHPKSSPFAVPPWTGLWPR